MTNIFLCYIMLFCLIKAFGGKAIFVTLLLYMFSYAWSIYLKEIYLPWRMEMVPVGLLYMCIGYNLKAQTRKKRDNDSILITTGIIISAVLIWYNYLKKDFYYAIDSHLLGNLVTSPVLALTVSITIILLVRKIPNTYTKMLEYMGRNSLVYYGVQQAMVSVTNTFILKVCGGMDMIASILVSLAALLLSLVIDTLFVYAWKIWGVSKISIMQ